MANQATDNQDIGSAFDLLGKSFDIVKQNWPAFLVVNILAVLGGLLALIPITDKEASTNASTFESNFSNFSGIEIGIVAGLGITFIIVFLLINLYLFAMQQILYTRAADGKKPSVGQLFSEANKKLIKLILLFLLGGMIIFVGLLLLIVPGIIAIGRIAMAPYVMIDQNLGVMDSLKESNRLSKKYTGKVWAALGVTILIAILASIIGFFPFVGQLVGVLVTIAFSLVLGLRYFQLKKLDSGVDVSKNTVAPPPVVESPPAVPVVP